MPDDVVELLLHYLGKLDCRAVGRCQTVCRRWRQIAMVDSLWRELSFQEFGLLQKYTASSFYQSFKCIQSDLALAPLRLEARLASTLKAVSAWFIRLERWESRGIHAHAPCGPDCPIPQTVLMHHCIKSQEQDMKVPMHPSNILCGAKLIMTELIPCRRVVVNRQSIWLRYQLPTWVKDVDEPRMWTAGSDVSTDDEEASVSSSSPVHQSCLKRWNELKVEAHMGDGRSPVQVISSHHFHMPRNDTEMLLQSHSEGLYAWEAAPGEEPWLDHTGNDSAEPASVHPPSTASGSQLHVVAYLHYEQLLPLTLPHIPTPQTLPAPSMPYWEPSPQPPQPPLRTAADVRTFSSSGRNPAAYLHVDWCQLGGPSGRKGSAWVALYMQYCEDGVVMMGVDWTEADVVILPGDLELSSSKSFHGASSSIADVLVSCKPPGLVSGLNESEQDARGIHPRYASTSVLEKPFHGGDPFGLNATFRHLEIGTDSQTSHGHNMTADSNDQTSFHTSVHNVNNEGFTQSSRDNAEGHTAASSSNQPHPFPPQRTCLSSRSGTGVVQICSKLAELCSGEGMVDFSLWSLDGRLLLGRAGVELWEKATDLVTAYCCHFLVDGVQPSPEGVMPSLWDNALWVRPDAGLRGAAFALSLTVESADAIFGSLL
ncbi:hypothetical protein CEUSTIGMA_g5097.t1 [Chlamydomonas eustigma]|uniref:F-box domain-containing protein n=1 Tax=Chlamydomonas eustigma TaxID=1157962 RepID=A0A250X3J9_9CHLO|nr:hypothetical protein CEUSTIGMA_g5097.t1 [Chlamydomonas eustigma]|eukprot:GAX77654.1 hypothetical protein CEUSTIGMA_g5097.t1 [Chlamydomonas eustigma]